MFEPAQFREGTCFGCLHRNPKTGGGTLSQPLLAVLSTVAHGFDFSHPSWFGTTLPCKLAQRGKEYPQLFSISELKFTSCFLPGIECVFTPLICELLLLRINYIMGICSTEIEWLPVNPSFSLLHAPIWSTAIILLQRKRTARARGGKIKIVRGFKNSWQNSFCLMLLKNMRSTKWKGEKKTERKNPQKHGAVRMYEVLGFFWFRFIMWNLRNIFGQ